jgi:hypothetical protein
MTSPVETTPLIEGELETIQTAAMYLKAAGIDHQISVAGDGVPGS